LGGSQPSDRFSSEDVMSLKIAILGAGNVGTALAKGWVAAGHEIRFGARRPHEEKVQALVSELGATAEGVAEAAAWGEVVVLATPWMAVPEVLAAAGSLEGKILLEATNPLKPALAGLELGLDTSGAEKVAALVPGAKVVKIFNTIGANHMMDAHIGGQKALMLYCGDDAEAKKVAHELAAANHFDPVDAGPLEQARLLEPMALLWISLAYQQGLGRNFGFSLLRG